MADRRPGIQPLWVPTAPCSPGYNPSHRALEPACAMAAWFIHAHPYPHNLPRSFPIEELAAEGDFIDSTFLLLHGELPSKQEKALFEREIKYHTLVHEQLIQFYRCVCVGSWGVGGGSQRPAAHACWLEGSGQRTRLAFEHTSHRACLAPSSSTACRGFRHDAHPMAIMCGVVGALAAFYPEVAEVK